MGRGSKLTPSAHSKMNPLPGSILRGGRIQNCAPFPSEDPLKNPLKILCVRECMLEFFPERWVGSFVRCKRTHSRERSILCRPVSFSPESVPARRFPLALKACATPNQPTTRIHKLNAKNISYKIRKPEACAILCGHLWRTNHTRLHTYPATRKRNGSTTPFVRF